VGAVAFYLFGILLMAMGYNTVAEIKSEVDFGDGDDYGIPHWIRIAILIIVVLVLFGAGYWFGNHNGS
jgi:hypothetical protein